MFSFLAPWLRLLLAASGAFLITLLATPPVKRFAERLGVMDVPGDRRRVHSRPVPRLGGLAIFLGLTASLLLFEAPGRRLSGLLAGAALIAAMGAADDRAGLNAWVKLAVQCLAAAVAIRSGIVFHAVSHPVVFSDSTTIPVGFLSVPLTLLWIVGCTNAVNLIDGLDGLAVGVSGISSSTMLLVSVFVSDPETAVLMAAVTGACLGFMPYNACPAQIFMGDAGSQLLGYVLACASVLGMFKFHTALAFLTPLLALGVPLTDTVSAFFRRVLHGQSPFQADRKHLHHRLLDMGLDQKQAVALLYCVSAALGLIAVLLCQTNVYVRAGCLLCAAAVSLLSWRFLLRHSPRLRRRRKMPSGIKRADQL